MNEKQRQYALNRTAEIFKQKKQEIEDRFTQPEVKLDFRQKHELIRQGDVLLLPEVDLNYYTKLHEAYDFTNHERKAAVDHTRSNAALASLTQEYHKVRDQIMLGDTQEAVKLLEQLANWSLA